MRFKTGMKVFPTYHSGCGWGCAVLTDIKSSSFGDGTQPPSEIRCETLSEVRWAVCYFTENISEFCFGTQKANSVAIMSDDWHRHISEQVTKWRLREPLRLRWV